MARRRDSLCARLGNYLLARADTISPLSTFADRMRKYAHDPVGFARDILKIQLSRAQRRIVEAVLSGKRVTVASGHKTGKSTAFSVLAHWFYATQPGNARVVITATTERQVKGIIWREIRRLGAHAQRAGAEIPYFSEMHDDPATGLINRSNLNEILGYTAKQTEAIAGVSGAAILYLVDEASGVADAIFDAMEGNRAGGAAWVLLASNPTKASGEFYESHHKKSVAVLGPDGYQSLVIDSRESPNCTGEWRELEEWDQQDGCWKKRTQPIPGMATPEWIAAKIAEHGEDSAFVCMRISGKFVIAEEAKACPLELLVAAQQRYDDADSSGKLHIGCDPAGMGRDHAAFAARRNQKILEVRKRHHLTPEAHVTEILDLIAAHPQHGKQELPVVTVDSDGAEGAKVWAAVQSHAQAHGDFVAVRFRGSDRPIVKEQARIYARNREALWAGFRDWLRAGGSLPADDELEADLHAPEFTLDQNNRLKLTPKEALYPILHRSPDKGDAVCLSTWVPRWVSDAPPPPPPPVQYEQGGGGALGGPPRRFDPYATRWQR